ncbi:MAG TPA: MarR family transcriptional regulator [Candidatus Lachnoclostridium avicola]|nr:MarR family transcriptional regulator [Candidatus Lachnoclostridium avicola]
METGKMINQISNRLRRRSRQVQEAIGISGAQGNILDYILVESRQRSVYQKEIEKEFGLRPSTATEALKLLEEKGLICRIPEEKDGRYKRIVFTPKAEAVQDALRREIEESEAILLQGIAPEEKELFLEIAGRMLRNLDEREDRHGKTGI